MRSIWIERTEGAKFWLKVFNEIRTRGVDDTLIAAVNGLKGPTEAIETAFPRTLNRAPDNRTKVSVVSRPY